MRREAEAEADADEMEEDTNAETERDQMEQDADAAREGENSSKHKVADDAESARAALEADRMCEETMLLRRLKLYHFSEKLYIGNVGNVPYHYLQ